jgi:hypothetical protein
MVDEASELSHVGITITVAFVTSRKSGILEAFSVVKTSG